MNTQQSEKLYQKAMTLMPGGVSSPVRAFKSVGGTPLFMHKGKGALITDEDNNTYIDYCMSWGPLILGHADEHVVARIKETASLGTSFGMPHKTEIELAEKITERFRTIERVRFVNSGTEACMSAIRLARGYTGKYKFMKCEGCYHGHVDHLLVASGSGGATLGVPDSAGVTADNVKDTIVIPYNNIEALKETLKLEGENIAAFILEPVLCNYGLVIPDPEYLQQLRELCTEYGILLIFDEVITGLRLAAGGAQEYFDVEADITTLGKIIGGGLPVGAYGASKEIMSHVAPEGPVYQAGTLSGNPLAMAAGIATLEQLDRQKAYAVLEEKAAYFNNLVGEFIPAYRGKIVFHQLGSIFSFVFTEKDAITSMEDMCGADMTLFARFHKKLLEKGIYFSPSGYEVGFISTAHSSKELEKTAQSIKTVLGDLL